MGKVTPGMRRWAVGLLLGLMVGVCWAQDAAPRTPPTAKESEGGLYVNYVKVLSLTNAEKGGSPQKALQHAAAVLMKYAKSGYVAAETKKGESVLSVGDKVVLRISKAEAESQMSDLDALGQLWAKNINEALNLPPVVFGAAEVKGPVGGSETVTAVGAGSLHGKYTVSDKNVAKVVVSEGQVLVSMVGPGTAVVGVTSGGFSTSFKVTSMPLAASFPQTVSAEVTGQPATSEVIGWAVDTAVRTRGRYVRGATVTVETATLSPLGTGGVESVAVPVTVRAPGYWPTSGTVTVTVRNRGVAKRNEQFLWYSNNPENLVDTGNLYFGQLEAETPVRLLSHHFDKTSRPMVVQYFLINNSDLPAAVTVMMGDSTPDKDPAKAGYRAGLEFFRQWLNDAAEVVQIPPRSVVPLSCRRLAPLETTSTLGTLCLLSGGPNSVTVSGEARWSADLPSVWASSLQRDRPWQYTPAVPLSAFDLQTSGSPKEVYTRPRRKVDFEYQVGGRFAFVRIGGDPIASVTGEPGLDGNFGVHYELDGLLTNPTDAPQKVEIVFEASAGYSGAFFVIDGQFRDARMLQSKQTVQLKEVTLNPGDKIPVTIQTMPLSGANYPATLMVRPVGSH